MKVTELIYKGYYSVDGMIGVNLNGKLFSLDGMFLGGCYDFDGNAKCFTGVGVSNINPIPLTEKILREVGFTGTTEYNVLALGTIRLISCCDEFDRPYCAPYHLYGDSIKINSIHEFQMLLRLSGQQHLEERIKLE